MRKQQKHTKKKKTNTNFKSNINVKPVMFGDPQKSCASNLLVAIKYLLNGSIQYVCIIHFIKIFFTV